MATANEMTLTPGAPEVRLERMRIEINPTVGETGIPFPAATLGPEHGYYVRRLQTAELRLPVPVTAGRHSVELVLDRAGVTEGSCADMVELK